jgi:hypothetical protein
VEGSWRRRARERSKGREVRKEKGGRRRKEISLLKYGRRDDTTQPGVDVQYGWQVQRGHSLLFKSFGTISGFGHLLFRDAQFENDYL